MKKDAKPPVGRSMAAQGFGRLARARAKLDDRTVMMVRDLRAAGVPEARLAAMAGVHMATVRQVVSRRTWRGLPPGCEGRGAFVLLSLPELLTERERRLVATALALTGGARDDHGRLYAEFLSSYYRDESMRASAPVRRRPSQLAVDAMSHPSRWGGAGGTVVTPTMERRARDDDGSVLRGRCHANDRPRRLP
jgi:hypothetical protein